MHPLTPAVRSWRVLVVVLFFLAQDFGQKSLQDGSVPDVGSKVPRLGGRVLAGGGLVLLLVLLAGIGFAVLSWRMTRYRVTAEALELHSGVLFRQQRRARLDRLQAVDVVQPFVARLFGLAQLTLEVAGAGDSKIALSFLTEKEAGSLRAHLLARAAGLHYDTHEAPQAPEHQVLEVPMARLLLSLVLSGAAVTVGVLVVALSGGAVALGNLGPLTVIIPLALGSGSLLWARFNGGFHFRVATSPDGLRLRHGLLEQRAQTVPPGRLQALRLEQPLLWRRVDWWRVRVNVAGYGAGRESARDTESTLLPVGTRGEAIGLVALVLPDLGDVGPDTPREVVEAAMSGHGNGHGFVGSPRSARWLDPIVVRRTGYRVTGAALLVRRGRLYRYVDVVPHVKTQSCGLRQGPLERRLGLATFVLHSTPGPVTPLVPHLEEHAAAALVAAQAERARRARAVAGPERWMEPSTP